MTTVDAKGIIRYEASDSASPLHTALNLGLDSVSNALNAPGYLTRAGVHTVANLSGLNSLRTQLNNAGYTGAAYAHRTDLGELWYHPGSGGSWDKYIPPVDDTGWLAVTPASGFTTSPGSSGAMYRALNGMVYFRGELNKTSGTIGSNETVGAIPSQFAPSYFVSFPLVTSTVTQGVRGRVTTAGQIGTRSGTTTGSQFNLGGISYPLG